MIKAHIKVMDNILEEIQDYIYFSKVIELDTKTIYVSYLWDIRIVVDDIKNKYKFVDIVLKELKAKTKANTKTNIIKEK